MPGQTGETDAARFQLDEKQHVVGGETSPGEHFHREEVGAGQDVHVRSNEILPSRLLQQCGGIPNRSSPWRSGQLVPPVRV